MLTLASAGMPSLAKMKLSSTSKQSKDKPVESQMRKSKNDKRKANVARTTVGNGTTNTAPVTQSANSSSAIKTSVSAKILKTASGLNVNPPPSSGAVAAAITGPAASTRGKKKAETASKTTTSPGTIGASSNPMVRAKYDMTLSFVVHPTSSIAKVTPPVPVTAVSSVGSISNILSTFANRYGAHQKLPPVQLTNTSGSPRSLNPITATKPVPSNTPVYSGRALPALPPNWETRYVDTYNSSSVYKTFPVEKGSSEFKAVADLLSPFRVTSAEQIINPELWQSFNEKRKAMLRSKSDDVSLLTGLGFDSDAVARSVKLSEQFAKHRRLTGKSGEYSANEALLLHCTKDPANLEKILVQGLDERLGLDGRLLGKGVYFSDDPGKCAHYDKTGGTILVFGVLLGDCLSVDNFPNVGSLVREPEKEADQKRNKNDHFFDSITGRPHRVHNEYVIFNRNQCYPFYLVKYMRAYREYPDPAQLNPYIDARKATPYIVAWANLPGERVPMPGWKWPVGSAWPFHAPSIFKSMGGIGSSAQKNTGDLTTVAVLSGKIKPVGAGMDLVNDDGGDGNIGQRVKRRRMLNEECSVCTQTFGAFLAFPSLWKELKCCHRVCSGCFKNIEVSRVTMSGMPYTSIRCPFCKGITGIAVGDCPDGIMTVSYINTYCGGNGNYNTIKIDYNINSGTHKLNRTAYLPNSPEGKEVLELLISAWDRKLTFTIGTSMTTGQQNVLVWNIHHKTSQFGGVQRYGYPDEGYFTRVRAELKALGIE